MNESDAAKREWSEAKRNFAASDSRIQFIGLRNDAESNSTLSPRVNSMELAADDVAHPLHEAYACLLDHVKAMATKLV